MSLQEPRDTACPSSQTSHTQASFKTSLQRLVVASSKNTRAWTIHSGHSESLTLRNSSGLSPKDWAILDAFENPLYEVQVVTMEDGRKALAYVWTVDLLTGAAGWTTASMTGNVLEEYLKRTKAWREDYDEQVEAS